ncbi:MAG: SDR family oxidoreductase [Sedimentisphaerales bacterium]
MDKALADLIKISRETGSNPSFVRGGGGNTSVKTNDGKFMFIKASGTALKDMSQEKGWRRLNIDSVRNILQDPVLTMLDVDRRELEVVNRLQLACDDEVKSGARPSVEAHLHAMLDKVVIHLHPVSVAAYVNSKNGKEKNKKLFEKSGIEKPLLWVPYVDPGFTLGKKVEKLVGDYRKKHGYDPQILFLEKHGIFVSANNVASALNLVSEVIGLCNSLLSQPKKVNIKQALFEEIVDIKLAIRKAVFETTGKYLPISFFPLDKTSASFLSRKDASRLLNAGALTPDELVYASGQAMLLNRIDSSSIAVKIKKEVSKGQKPPASFLVKGAGLFVASDVKIATVINEIVADSLLVRMYASQFGGVLALTNRQRDFVNNWESEVFRKKQAGGVTNGILENRIALVTGAGSGLGKSIAIGMARAGAMVALVDIDEKAAVQTAETISRELPNAQTLEINLTGYFLMAQAAARIMIKQDIGGNIINLSSKSGLGASVNNSAYNATKSGEIHLARGWALELGQFGIRVNSVCPGNVFEGSKIWNPEYIKICAKKYGIKPEEVIPYYVAQTALKREIKGQDIADSIVFLCSVKARTITGQTLVADAGQVMVR